MTTQAKQVVQDWFAAVERNDSDAVMGAFDASVHHWLIGSTPLSGLHPSLDSFVQQVIVPMQSQIDGPLKLHLKELIGEGDRVVALAEGEGKGKYGPYNNTYAMVFTVRNGKITSFYEYCDTALVETAMYGRKLV